MASTSEHEIYLHDRILEKLVLWMIPHWISPNMISVVRLIMTPFVVYVNYIQNYTLGVPLFLFAAFTDALDGSLARTRNQITNVGRLLDPFADKLLIGSMVVLLVFQHLQPVIGYTIIVVELVFILFGAIQGLRGKVSQANVWGKIKMLLQVTAVGLILAGLTVDSPWFLAAASWIFGASLVFAVVSLLFHGI